MLQSLIHLSHNKLGFLFLRLSIYYSSLNLYKLLILIKEEYEMKVNYIKILSVLVCLLLFSLLLISCVS